MTRKIIISESQYRRVFLSEQNDFTDFEKKQIKSLSDNWKSMSKIEKMRYIFPDHFSNQGFGDEGFWAVTFEFLPEWLQRVIKYGQDLEDPYFDHEPNSQLGKYYENYVRQIATPEEWMKLYPYTMGKVFDPSNDKNKFKDIKSKWGSASARDIELLMIGANSIEDFDNFRGDMSVEAKKQGGEHDYWSDYYAGIAERQQEDYYKSLEEHNRLRWEEEKELAKANEPAWKRTIDPYTGKLFASADDYYAWIHGDGKYSIGAIVKDLPAPIRWATQFGAGIMLIADDPKAAFNYVYSIFDCGEESGLEYFHCVMGNASMAISLVPVLGTLGSGIIDFVDAGVYFVEAGVDNVQGNYYLLTGDVDKAQKEFQDAAIKTGWGALSALGIIPGVTEAKLLFKAGDDVLKSADNIFKELGEKELKNVDPKEFNEILEKNTKHLSDTKKKQVGEVMEEMTNPKIREEVVDITKRVEDWNILSENIRKSNRLTKHQWNVFLNGSDFKKLMQKHGGDALKALRDKTIKELITTFTIQVSLTTVVVVGQKKIEGIKLERLKEDAAKGNISSIVMLEGYPWDKVKEAFRSNGSGTDNDLLKKAWASGWRPWGIDYGTGKALQNPEDKDYEDGMLWLYRNEEYQTQTFKDELKKKFTPEDIKTDDIEKSEKNIELRKKQDSIQSSEDYKTNFEKHDKITDEKFDPTDPDYSDDLLDYYMNL